MEKENHPMILEYTTVEGNQMIKLPLRGKPLKAEVNWGDGSPIQIVTNKYPAHEYTKSGVYEVMISGIVPRIDSYDLSVSERQYLTGIKSWGKLDGLTSMHQAFLDYENLRGELPGDDYGCFENVTDFYGCFSYCIGLTGNIPANLFANCSNVTDFGYCFYRCSGLTSIPEGLFANCPNVTDFECCFNRCSGLTGNIPENLFSNCPSVTNFRYCFDGCKGLTSIPANLFSNCPNVTSFDYCFSYCSGLTFIPEKLFSNCPNVTNFSSCFFNCTILSNNRVKLTNTTPVDVMKNDGCVEYGKCEICGKEAPLTRTNYYYYVGNKCECCGTKDNTHFVIQRHCYSCSPKPPETIKVTLKADNSGFRQKLETLINNFSKENGSNTPDYILANYLLGCLNNFDTCVNARDKYYRFKTK